MDAYPATQEQQEMIHWFLSAINLLKTKRLPETREELEFCRRHWPSRPEDI